MKQIIFSLPDWLVTLLKEYESEGHIEIGKFIVDSISDFITTFNLEKDVLSISDSPKIDVAVELPLDIIQQINSIVEEYGVKASDIVFTILGYTVPVLMAYVDEYGEYYQD